MRSGSSDALVVPSAQLAEVLNLWLLKHNGRFPVVTTGEHVITGYGYILAQKPQLSERAIYRIVSGETKYTTFAIADEILTAIEEMGALSDGRIDVLPNPRWNNETWIAWKAEQGCI